MKRTSPVTSQRLYRLVGWLSGDVSLRVMGNIRWELLALVSSGQVFVCVSMCCDEQTTFDADETLLFQFEIGFLQATSGARSDFVFLFGVGGVGGRKYFVK